MCGSLFVRLCVRVSYACLIDWCAQVEKAREAQVIGILIATLSTANFTDVAAKLRAMIAAAGMIMGLT